VKCVSNTNSLSRSTFCSESSLIGMLNAHSFLEAPDKRAGRVWKVRVATLLLSSTGLMASECTIMLAPGSVKRILLTSSRTSALLWHSRGIPRNLKLRYRLAGMVLSL